MAGPWEKYAAEQNDAGPWVKYAQEQKQNQNDPQQGVIDETISGMKSAASGAAGKIADYLNPFSEARHASYAKQAQLPLGAAIGENLSQVGNTGRAMLAPVTGAGEAFSAATTPVPARAWQYANRAAGVDLPYDTAKQQVELAMAGARPANATPRGLVTEPNVPPAIEHISAAKTVYQDPTLRLRMVQPQDLSQTAARIDKALTTFHPDTEGKVFNIADEMRAKAAQPFTTLDQLDNWSTRLGRLADETRQARDGTIRPTPQAAAAQAAKVEVDSLTRQIAPEWGVADKNYAAGLTAQSLDKKSLKALTQSESKGPSYSDRMKTAATNLLTREGATRNYSPEDLALLKTISTGTRTQNAMEKAAEILGYNRVRYGLGGLFGGGAGYAAGGPVGALAGSVLGIGTDAALTGILTAGKNRIATKNADALVKSLLSKSPLSKSLPPSAVEPSKLAILTALLNRDPMALKQIPAYADQDQ